MPTGRLPGFSEVPHGSAARRGNAPFVVIQVAASAAMRVRMLPLASFLGMYTTEPAGGPCAGAAAAAFFGVNVSVVAVAVDPADAQLYGPNRLLEGLSVLGSKAVGQRI